MLFCPCRSLPGGGRGYPTRVPRNGGDWVIAGEERLADQDLVVAGNVLVVAGGTLILDRMNLEMRATDGEVPGIRVEPQGSLRITNSTVFTKSDSGFDFSAGSMSEPNLERSASLYINNTQFLSVNGLQLNYVRDAVIMNNTIGIHAGNMEYSGISLIGTENCLIQSNRLKTSPPVSSGLSAPAANGIFMDQSRGNRIIGNSIMDAGCAISMGYAWDNYIAQNTCVGPVGVPNLQELTSKWWVLNTTEQLGGGSIAIGVGSHNNTIEENTFLLSNTSLMFLGRSSHNRILRNTVKGAKIGLALIWTTHNVISGNEFADIWRYDAVHAYRATDNHIINNRFDSVHGAIGLHSSDRNVVQANEIVDAGRGIFLHGSQENRVINNSVLSTAMPIVLTGASDNTLQMNNFTQSGLQRFDDGDRNTWEENYWEADAIGPYAVPPNGVDTSPASTPQALVSAEEPDMGSKEFQSAQVSDAVITDHVVWQDETVTMTDGLTVADGGSLTLRNVTLNVAASAIPVSYTRAGNPLSLKVTDGGSLFVYDSRINGAAAGTYGGFQVAAFGGANFVIRNSSIRDCGWWCGDAAVALEEALTGGVVENCDFENTYCAVSLENVSNCFVNDNRISNAVIGITILGGGNNTVRGNRISQVAWSGIEIYNDTTIVEDNTITGGWGIGIIPFHFGTLPRNNTFQDFTGPTYRYVDPLILMDSVTFKAFSFDSARVAPGQAVKVVLRLTDAFPNFGNTPGPTGPATIEEAQSLTLACHLRVNETPIDRRLVEVKMGQTAVVELTGVAPEEGTYDIHIEQSDCAFFDPARDVLHLPCLDFGRCHWLDLRIPSYNPLFFSLGGFGTTWCREPSATFDLTSNVLRVPCLDLGNLQSYWLELLLRNPESLIFEVDSYGMN